MAEPFPLIDLEGDAEQRGRRHGRDAGERIARGLQLYREDFERRGLDWSSTLVQAEKYLPLLSAYDSELTTEISAIAGGAEQPAAAIVLLNVRSEMGAQALEPDECTAVLALPEATADQHVLHGQNWDWRPGCCETGVVLRIGGPGDHQALIFCEAGQLARHGMNNAGIALTANGLQVDADSRPGGVPTPIVRRRMLMQSTLPEATGVLFAARRSGSYALMLSHRDGEACCIEATPDRVFWLTPADGVMSHANHFKDIAARLHVEDLSLLHHPESIFRDHRAMGELTKHRGAVSRQTLEVIFGDRFGWPNSICRPPTRRRDGAVSATVASLIMDTTEGKMWLAPAPYERVHYTEYSFA